MAATVATPKGETPVEDHGGTPLVVGRSGLGAGPCGGGTLKRRLAGSRAVRDWTMRHGIPVDTVLLGAFAVVLARYAQSDEAVFALCNPAGSPTVVRIPVPPDAHQGPWLLEVDSLRQTSGIVRRDLPAECAWLLDLAGDSANPPPTPSRTRPMVVRPIHRDGEATWLSVHYARERLDAHTVSRFAGHLGMVLRALLGDATDSLSGLAMLTDRERHRLLIEWNDTRVENGHHRCLHQLFEAQARRTPHAPAVIHEDGCLTYAELDRWSNQVARRLQALGVAPETMVGLCDERSPEMVVGLLGILKSGGAYVPLEPTDASGQINLVVEETRLRIVVSRERFATHFASNGIATLCLDRDASTIRRESANPVANPVTGTNLVSVLYTSGSTGRPKGTLTEHRALSNNLLWMQDCWPLGPGDRLLQKAPFTFDVSFKEFLWPLMCGACMVLARPGGHLQPRYLRDVIRDTRVTVTHFVPSMLQHFLDLDDVETCTDLRLVMCGAEALSLALLTRFRRRLRADLLHLYGPTEAAIAVTGWLCEQARPHRGPIPLGRAMHNARIYLLNGRGEPVPVGVPGELHIGGVPVARGYLDRPAEEAQGFVTDPFDDGPNARLYRTGDLARYWPNGNLQFLGRIDHQLKIRGVRVEPTEVEFVLGEHPAVRKVAVAARPDQHGETRLIAWIEAHCQPPPRPFELRAFAVDRLPGHMVPAALVIVDDIPLLTNGKVNYRALPWPV